MSPQRLTSRSSRAPAAITAPIRRITAGLPGSFNAATAAVSRALAVTYCVRSLLPIEKNAASMNSSGVIATAGTSTMMPSAGRWHGTPPALSSAITSSSRAAARPLSAGTVTIGSTGEFWTIIFTTGFVGAAIYYSYFLVAFWRLRRDRTLTGPTARLIILLTLFYTYFYNNVPAALALAFISMSISWRTISDPDPPPPAKAAPAELPPPARSTLLEAGAFA